MKLNLLIAALFAVSVAACSKPDDSPPASTAPAANYNEPPTMDSCTKKAKMTYEVRACRATKGDFAEACFQMINEYQSLCMAGLK